MKEKESPDEKSMFVEFFGNYPAIRALDFLIGNDVFDYSKKDIGRNSDVSRNTLETLWKNLEGAGIVSYTRKVGKASRYKINRNSPIVKQLAELDKKPVKNSLENIQEGKEKKGKVRAFA